jgi:hypothetical protein
MALSSMNQCKNLDDFHDILFQVDDSHIKANSVVLKARCPYFHSMLSAKYHFRESQASQVRVEGVPKTYFTCIV